MDTLKVRIQIISEKKALSKDFQGSTNVVVILKDILKNEGPKALFKGLDAALAR